VGFGNASFFSLNTIDVTELPSVLSFAVIFNWQYLPQFTAVGAF